MRIDPEVLFCVSDGSVVFLDSLSLALAQTMTDEVSRGLIHQHDF